MPFFGFKAIPIFFGPKNAQKSMFEALSLQIYTQIKNASINIF